MFQKARVGWEHTATSTRNTRLSEHILLLALSVTWPLIAAESASKGDTLWMMTWIAVFRRK